jgi:hypothetical protein
MTEHEVIEGRSGPNYNPALIEHLTGVCFGPGVSSFNRLDVFMALTRPVLFDVKPAEVFGAHSSTCGRPVTERFATMGRCLGGCAGTDGPGHRSSAVVQLRAVNFLPEEDKAFFDALPDPVPVFRGCSRKHVKALCWITDRKVAEKFAGGIRVPVPSPVVASALITKDDVFGVCTRRNESDVLLDPSGLMELTVERLKKTKEPKS